MRTERDRDTEYRAGQPEDPGCISGAATLVGCQPRLPPPAPGEKQPPVIHRSAPPRQPTEGNYTRRWREHTSWRHQLSQTTRESPSWLASLALHALWMVLLSSLVGSRMQNHPAPITLTLASHENPSDDPETFTATAIVTKENTQDESANEEGIARKELAVPPGALLETPSQDRSKPVETLTALAASSRPRAMTHNATMFESQQPHSHSERDRLDNIVDRFIEFDIGRLRGQAGRRAHEEFMRLGPEAIPALVRGLNKAARISASCPIGVISSKLSSEVAAANDPDMLRYVLEHAGREVPESAPHYRRIASLKSKWAQQTPEARRLLAARQTQRRESRLARQTPEQRERLVALQKRIAARHRTDAARRAERERGRKSPQDLLRAARTLNSKGERQAAVQQLKQLVQQHPNTKESRTARKVLRAWLR